MEIKLGGKNGGVAIVDEEYYEMLMQHSWYKDDEGYVYSTINNDLKMGKIFLNILKRKN